MIAQAEPTLTTTTTTTIDAEAPTRAPDALRMVGVGDDELAPAAPSTVEETGLDESALNDLILKLACTVPHLTAAWASGRLCLPEPLVERLLWQMKEDQLVEILGQTGEFDYRYCVTTRGREFGRRAMEVSGYVGPAPVTPQAYAAMLEWQTARRQPPTLDEVRRAMADLVLPEASVEVAALAALSQRSLFVFGPPGNGKTSLARALHRVLTGSIWIPHCIAVDSSVIRIFDPQVHEEVASGEWRVASNDDSPLATRNSQRATPNVDPRWVRVRPPIVVAGGEMTIDELDLTYSPSLRFYEAPPHVKANGGTFIIDDFGRQRVDPHDLLNRWIIPLERQVDYMTLNTGQKLELPFRLMLTVATNLDVNEVCDAAFLRRMGYRLLLERPTPEVYAEVFRRYATSAGLTLPAGLIEQVLNRYRDEHRDLRASEPRDLIERVRDLCKLQRRPFALDAGLLSTAWNAYFGLTAR